MIDLPSSFEQLRTTSAGDCLRVLVEHLCKTCTNPVVVAALLCVPDPVPDPVPRSLNLSSIDRTHTLTYTCTEP